MFSGFGVALSGIHAAGQVLSTKAHNISNAQTEGFKRIRPILESSPAGGVIVSLQKDGRSAPPVFDEDSLGVREGSNVELEEELVGSLEASHLFQANVASLNTQNKVVGSFLDILG